MTSKNISITEDVYKKLMKIKKENESFSELFLRLLRFQKDKKDKTFGAWNLSKKEKNKIWDEDLDRPGRSWKRSGTSEIK